MHALTCVRCNEIKKNIHLCEFKGNKIICDDCCKLIQSEKRCTVRGCAHMKIKKGK